MLAVVASSSRSSARQLLTVFSIRGIVQNTAILAVWVSATCVIVTGIDLSVGSVLVFSGVVADKAMAAV